MTRDQYRQLYLAAENARLRAEHVLKAAGLPVPPRLPAAEATRLFDADLLCPRCGAELPMPIRGEPGWFCVHCGQGWAKEWRTSTARLT